MSTPPRYSDRQRAMLTAMGLRVWSPRPPASVQASPAPAATQAPIARATPPAPHSVSEARIVEKPDAPAVRSPLAGSNRPNLALMDWDELERTVAGCRACALCETRTHTVFGVGSRQAAWMIVGEAPGEQEDLQGEPFVGAAGQLLDRMLAAAGLTRHTASADTRLHPVYIANTLKCRPPRNRNPQPQELQQCEPYLVRQIELLQPRLIVAMGRFAVQTLLNSQEPIGRLRARVHQARSIPTVVTYHPAYLLRNPQDKAKAWEDLCLALQTVDPSP